jgi:hypothetical protein
LLPSRSGGVDGTRRRRYGVLELLQDLPVALVKSADVLVGKVLRWDDDFWEDFASAAKEDVSQREGLEEGEEGRERKEEEERGKEEGKERKEKKGRHARFAHSELGSLKGRVGANAERVRFDLPVLNRKLAEVEVGDGRSGTCKRGKVSGFRWSKSAQWNLHCVGSRMYPWKRVVAEMSAQKRESQPL